MPSGVFKKSPIDRLDILVRACVRLSLDIEVESTLVVGEVTLHGASVKFPELACQLFINLASGNIHSHDPAIFEIAEHRIRQLIQIYSVELAKAEFESQGLTVEEVLMPDGSVRLRV